MKKFIFTSLFFALLFVFVGNINAQSASSISVGGSIGAVKRGGSVKGSVVLNVPDGLHVNSSRPNSQYAIPTSVKISGAGVKLSAVSYPRGRNRKFEFSEDTLNVYEGRTAFGFTVAVPQNFKGNIVKIRAVVRYQACTNQVCYPPKSQEITLTAQVK